MSQDLTPFANGSPEEIEAIFDIYIEDGFSDIPADVFFATLALMDQKQPVRHTQPYRRIELKTLRFTSPWGRTD